MLGMQEGQNDPYLDVLKEIKSLMDSRLGDKLKGGVSVEKVEVLPVEGEEMPVEAVEEKPEGEELGLSPEEKDKLKQMYSDI